MGQELKPTTAKFNLTIAKNKSFCYYGLKPLHLPIMSNLKSNLDIIHARIKQCDTSLDERSIIGGKILQLSPKKAGGFLEQFCRNIHTFSIPTGGDHDATNDQGAIEIKCSRVISSDKTDADNLLDEFLQNNRGLLNFSEGFMREFDCNIQQVKPDCFQSLYYYLIFADCIVSFRANKDAFSINSKEIYGNVLRQAACDNVIDQEYAQFLTSKTPIMGLKLLDSEHKNIAYIQHGLEQCRKLAQLKYSDKQHRGNTGEGQFHITNKNLAYHLEENFVAAYNYSDFKRVLKSIAAKPVRSKVKI